MVDTFVKASGERSAIDITKLDVAGVIEPIAKAGRYQALNMLRAGVRLYCWAIESKFDIAENPFAKVSPTALIGCQEDRRFATGRLKITRSRPAGEIGGPHGAVLRLLILTGKRLIEIACSSW